jgi:hypothetical protein
MSGRPGSSAVVSFEFGLRRVRLNLTQMVANFGRGGMVDESTLRRLAKGEALGDKQLEAIVEGVREQHPDLVRWGE